MLNPQDLLNFIELPVFSKRWEKLGLDVEVDLAMLQSAIMANPKAAPIIRGTKSIRKGRFAPERWGTGESGAARVLYVYFEQFGMVLLCLVYGKNEISTISDSVKSYLNKLVLEAEKELRTRFG